MARLVVFINESNKCIDQKIVEKYKGNTVCLKNGSRGGAGGYISGIVKIESEIIAYATIGGRGVYDSPNKGGYGGGGNSINSAGSGGGQTAVKFINNDLWHRVIVGGAGGGSDNSGLNSPIGNPDDGSGGSGGGFIAQGHWHRGTLTSDKVANSSFGFSFGYGESGRNRNSLNKNGYTSNDAYEKAGAGSGWFGGFARHDSNSGSGGGSSWVLTEDSVIPEGNIPAYDSSYTLQGNNSYAFGNKYRFLFHDVETVPGI
ncbi:hypothetical protein TVAG_425110 [Trichomonas vaginalis G3]|uniref:receptor protein-tyrosine kinase n=1 Tax=Trichomonas vaginalis (strain ATCC PRA-98 / G3) TaxID=412133 RepID=A2F5G1_TRIV3|nr:glycine-rich protein family [Trichomonas vaginalis G3]EAX99874.1 hypothetical protein TVAG_425110 [Trichomonas vaginalis G3]KAI5504859.1 glycine-rich protein family [Trichomonas vaginalis G3]|eukprot:XP_001312804.1 hypothetical protein [Trichomonas vaginalis G3]